MTEIEKQMVKLSIDGKEVCVPKGTNLLEAAKTVGIIIPHFCYHEALGSVGACRLCAVKVLEGPPPAKGLKMSCMIEAADGMVVSTTDPEAQLMRKMVIEWLMTNHPHDCPVCDEGGECLLQDMTIAGGHSIRRYRGKKRTYRDQDLGPYIRQEMNRCIQCYRCSRFYQEFAGGTDFGPLGISNHVFYGRFNAGALDSPFAGNIVDICPTGVFTDKTARFQARWWDYEMAPSVCPVCSLGCSVLPMARYRELLKTQGRYNEKVNGHFICDKGRFSQSIVNGPQRIRSSFFNGHEVSLESAFKTLAGRLSELIGSDAGNSVGILCSTRATFETQLLVRNIADLLKTRWVSYFSDPVEEERTRAAVKLLNNDNAISMREIEHTGFIVIVGTDLLNEAPMMGLAVRQAYRRNARVVVLHSARPELPLPFDFIESPVEKWKEELKKIFSRSMKELERNQAGEGANNRMPVIICGVESCPIDLLELAADIGREVSWNSHECKVSFILKGPNSFGAALLTGNDASVTAFADALRSGKMKTLLAIEPDYAGESLLGKILQDLLGNAAHTIDFFAVADHTMQECASKAHLIIPTTTYAEMNGTYINQEGRAQRFLKVISPGLRIRHLDPAFHPPRQFRMKAPGSDIIPAEFLLKRLLEELGRGRRSEVTGGEPFSGEWEKIKNIDPEGTGIRILK